MKDKVILVDCDGVLFDWVFAFNQWMTKHGYKEVNTHVYDVKIRYGLSDKESKMLIRMFNESAWIRALPPLRDAIKYVKKLHKDHGFIFHAITSLSNDYYAQHLRTKNLIEMFGPTVFQRYVYLDTGADKDHELEHYRDSECYWIEDKPENAVVGANLGLNSLLMKHDFNRHFDHEKVTKVSNWKELYEIIAN